MFNEKTLPNCAVDTELSSYKVMEHFYTIQGEGVHTGRAAYFIRLAGCDVRCFWCDVKDSWDASMHLEVTVTELVNEALKSKSSIAVITGGEPLLHNLDDLSSALKSSGINVHLETSGSSPFSGYFDWVTLSPKKFKKPVENIYQFADELKVVVLNKKDFEWAEENALKCPSKTKLLLQPEWDTPESVNLIVNYVKTNPKWGVSLQTHKFLNIP